MKLPLCLLAIVAVISTFILPVNATELPEYKVKPFSTLCANIENQAAYTSGFLSSMWKIEKGEGEWLVTTGRDFTEEIGIPDLIAKKELSRLIRYLNQHGTKLMLVYPPTRGVLYPKQTRAKAFGFNAEGMRQSYLQTLQSFRQLGAYVPALEDAFKYKEDFLFFPKDSHWSQKGAVFYAKRIAEQMDQLGFTDTGESRFQTTYSGIVANGENVLIGVEGVCGYSFPRLFVKTHVTTELASGDDLFSTKQTNEPHIVLLGTSFSAQSRFNFAGYLQQFANTSVADFSITGGGFTGAWINYLKSGEFGRQKPDLIIWEVPGWWQFEARYFDAILPYFQNGCDSSNAMMRASQVSLDPINGAKSALFSTQFTHVASKNLLLDIRLDNSLVENVRLRAWFSSGLSKAFRLRREPGTQSDGRFLGNLGLDHNYTDQGVVAIDVESIEYANNVEIPQRLRGDIRLCKSSLPYAD